MLHQLLIVLIVPGALFALLIVALINDFRGARDAKRAAPQSNSRSSDQGSQVTPFHRSGDSDCGGDGGGDDGGD
jgi:hypothetical protein